MSPNTDLEAFARSVRGAALLYLADARNPHAGEHREAVERLAKQIRRALDGRPDATQAVADVLNALHPVTRQLLDEWAAPYRKVPTRDELLHPDHGRDSLALLYGLCHLGAEWVPGRKRPGGKQSRPTLRGQVIGPRVRRRRPPNYAEFLLCTRLGIIYYEATTKPPPRRADARNPGPFVRLVDGVLKLLGAPGVNAAELVEAYGAYRRK